ncbi:hypothetical protein L596_005100 [Steinernema carpocapsae]|uniref:Uncharacterized protein n=1 Tax=Steinernema carpocapsae TaxID=34508 RepID=A0A4U8V255_STECR|nr:hypothetical protein L596_005100 [Steinernema carpocapsae]
MNLRHLQMRTNRVKITSAKAFVDLQPSSNFQTNKMAMPGEISYVRKSTVSQVIAELCCDSGFQDFAVLQQKEQLIIAVCP